MFWCTLSAVSPVLTEIVTEVENHNSTHGKTLLEDAKKANKEHTTEERIKNCEGRKNGLTTKVTELQKNAQKHLDKISGVLTKLQDAQKAGTLKVTNIDTLLADAVSAQTKAKASVDALKALTPTVDCTKASVAMDVATFKAAAEQARTDLKTYKTAL